MIRPAFAKVLPPASMLPHLAASPARKALQAHPSVTQGPSTGALLFHSAQDVCSTGRKRNRPVQWCLPTNFWPLMVSVPCAVILKPSSLRLSSSIHAREHGSMASQSSSPRPKGTESDRSISLPAFQATLLFAGAIQAPLRKVRSRSTELISRGRRWWCDCRNSHSTKLRA